MCDLITDYGARFHINLIFLPRINNDVQNNGLPQLYENETFYRNVDTTEHSMFKNSYS